MTESYHLKTVPGKIIFASIGRREYISLMSTLEIVILSVFGGAAALAAMAGIAVLIWIALHLRKALEMSHKESLLVFNEARAQVAQNQAEMKATFESARNTFLALRSDMTKTLDLHQTAMREVVARINADAITQNISRMIAVCQRLENGINIFTKLLFENQERGSEVYAPEQTAPETAEFGGPPSNFSISQSAQYDADAEREAEREVLQESGGN